MAVDTASMIRDARRTSGLSQAALAEKLSTTQSAVSRWERGHDEPRITTLDAILRQCGRRLVLKSEATTHDDVDRAQIRQQLAMTPDERLASVVNVSRFVASARKVS